MEGKCAREGKCDEKELCKGFRDVAVVENENRRSKAISFYPKEVEQVCKDIAAYFKAESGGADRKREKELDDVLGPEALRALLRNVEETGDDNRTVWFFEYKLMSAAEIGSRGVLEPCGLVPFAENVDGDMLAVGEAEHDGGVFNVSSEGEVEGGREATSLAEYLEAYRDDLLSSKLEFVEDCGMVEKTPAAGSPAGAGSKK